MSTKVKLVKKGKIDNSVRVVTENHVKNEQQRDREIVSVIKSWIDEFKLQTVTRRQAALVLLNK